METYISIDCVLEQSSSILEASAQACNNFFQFMDNWGHTYSAQADRKKQLDECLNEGECMLRTEEKEQEAILQRIQASVADLELAESAVNALRDTEALKKSECLTHHKNIGDLRNQIEAFSKLKETLRTNRDEILAYKLISNIEFVYSTKRISGIVVREEPVAFDLKPENLTQEQITETLWDLILKE